MVCGQRELGLFGRLEGAEYRAPLSAHRHYEELRSRSVAHDSALRQALAIAPAPYEPARERITPLCFASRA